MLASHLVQVLNPLITGMKDLKKDIGSIVWSTTIGGWSPFQQSFEWVISGYDCYRGRLARNGLDVLGQGSSTAQPDCEIIRIAFSRWLIWLATIISVRDTADPNFQGVSKVESQEVPIDLSHSLYPTRNLTTDSEFPLRVNAHVPPLIPEPIS